MNKPINFHETQFQTVNTSAMKLSLEGDGTDNNPAKHCKECKDMDMDTFMGDFKKTYKTRRDKLSKFDEDFTGEVMNIGV
jgi:hypothetical protein